MQYWLSKGGTRYLFALLVTAVGALASRALGAWSNDALLPAMPFFPAILAVTMFAGVWPAVGCWVLSLLVVGMAGSHAGAPPASSGAGMWMLGVFGGAAGLTIAIAAVARRVAMEEKATLLLSGEQARTDATDAARMRDELLSRISHELRTPLSAILGWTQVLRAQTPPAAMAHGLEVIERNARAQTRIIENLIDTRKSASVSPAERPEASTVGSAAQPASAPRDPSDTAPQSGTDRS